MHCPDSANGEEDGPRVMKGRRFKVIVVPLNIDFIFGICFPQFLF